MTANDQPWKRQNRNKETLDLFVQYCTEHPEFRFWQAVSNFLGNEGKLVIIPSKMIDLVNLAIDPYNWEYRHADGDHPETIQPLLKGSNHDKRSA